MKIKFITIILAVLLLISSVPAVATASDTPGITDNTDYYIMETATTRLLSLSSANDTNRTYVSTAVRSSNTMAQWHVEKQSDGSYQFISVYSPTAKVMSALGTSLVIYEDTDAEYQRFNIQRIDSGSSEGAYYIRYGELYVTKSSTNGVALTTSPTLNSAWSFMACQKTYADLFNHNYSYTDGERTVTYNTTDHQNTFLSIFENAGYDSYKWTNETSEYAYYCLRNESEIFIFRGHGSPGVIGFYNDDAESNGCIYAHEYIPFPIEDNYYYINDCQSNELSQLRCVLYLGCDTGYDFSLGSYVYNLVDATYEKGAHFVLGITESTRMVDNNAWLGYFLNSISNGVSIAYAIDQANAQLAYITIEEDHNGQKNRVVYGLPTYSAGDSDQYLILS